MAFAAPQLIYANVDRKLSASGRDGYQIWLKTPNAFDEREETEIQSRLSDYEHREDSTVVKGQPAIRHTYFQLSSGRVVLARTVPMAETDEFHRGGRFYAHAIALGIDDFQRYDFDPFVVLDQMAFQGAIEDGKKAGDPSNGTIPAASFGDPKRSAVAEMVPQDRIEQALRLLLQACHCEKPKVFGVVAPPANILMLVRQLLQWLPRSLRLKCSFDTLSTGKSLTQLPFAVAGLPANLTRRYPNLVLFDTVKMAPAAPLVPSVQAFDQWLLSGRRTPPDSVRSEAAFGLCRALDELKIVPEAISNVDDELYAEIVGSDAGVAKLERMIWPRLQADVGDVLSPLIYSHALAWLRAGGLESMKRLAEPLDLGMLLRWMVAAFGLRMKHEVQPETEMPALKDFLERTKNVEGGDVMLRKRLVLIFYRWSERWSSIAKSVCDPRTIPDEIFSWFVDWCLRSLPANVIAGCNTIGSGAWCGPVLAPTDGAEGVECQSVLGALLGQAKLGDGESSPDGTQHTLPVERWNLVVHYLLQRMSVTPPAELESDSTTNR